MKRGTSFSFFIPLILAGIYLLFLQFFDGVKMPNLAMLALMLGAYYINEKSKRFILGFLPIIIYMILYDAMRFFPNYLFQEVDINKIYHLEKNWFGIDTAEGRLTPNEYFRINRQTWLDFISGFIYGNWFNFPFILAIYFFLRQKKWVLEFGLAFLFLNILGIITYYVYPLAPPWYLEIYGFEWYPEAKPYEAGLENFDKMFGISLFKNMYSMNSQVFAALPSLHSAFPVVVLFYGIRTLKYINIIFIVHMIGIWFFAIYLRHHYILDILLGVLYAMISCFTLRYLRDQTRLKAWFDRMEKKL